MPNTADSHSRSKTGMTWDQMFEAHTPKASQFDVLIEDLDQ